jgi:hypothetical protein
MSADPAIVVIIHDAPTDWIRLPKFETSAASQMKRKLRCRSGANAEVRGAGEAAMA